MATSLSEIYPWTAKPIIINAPMAGFAGSNLATAVTKAGGLGLIGVAFDMKALADQLEQAEASLSNEKHLDCSKTLPIGVGLLPFISKLEEAIPIIATFKPSTVWFFAAKEFEDYSTWSQRVREVSPDTKIWIQVGSVTAALQVAQLCSPDVLVLQGIDAGGHGFEKGAGIISLLPEAMDALQANGFGNIPLVASGGIVDGRGVASALALGAQGVVMGTCFLAAPETAIHPKYRAAVLAAKDGGQSTVRAKIFDELRGSNIWPVIYDGRGLVTKSYLDYVSGVSIEKIRELYADAVQDEDAGFGKNQRAAVWAGTGVGLVKEIKPAAEIVNEVRNAAREAIDLARAKL
jgi:nitronate monooxygenase